ncbi:hypothetical protein AGMMS49543_09910 [Betaproteobacteria bacterium]|nr:hypothetical protein AGMMS49543_09910 [Betaproteobacteria bacterium]GHU19956.1 hypothetical protein AGMMS50243_13240 [Betaproteobacteria bacterium]
MNGIEPRRKEPGKLVSLILTVIVHGGLALFLFFGVRWQSSPPATLEVELVGPLKLASAPPPTPRVQTPPTPKPPPVVKDPPPPPPPPPPPQVKPEIAVSAPKKPPEPPKPPPPKPPATPKPPETKPPVQRPKPPTPDYMSQLLEKEIGKSEEAKVDKLLGGDSARASAPQNARALAAYANLIAIKVRSKMVAPMGLSGNPKAEFTVVQLPSGEVTAVHLKRSSGFPQFDAAVERAIYSASPLPLPDDRTLFQREFPLVQCFLEGPC